MEKDSKNQRRQSKQFTTTNESTSNESSLKSSGKRITNEISKFELKIGLLVEAKDSANNWYKSRIIKLDQEANRCKVHFLGWNSRYDQWFDFDSNDLRICSDQTQTNEIASHENSNEPTKPKQNSRESAQFKTGDLVLAKWTDECFYQARIARVTYKNDQLYYEVKFYDGIKKLLRSQFVRAFSEEEAKTLGIETDAISNIEIPVQEAQVTKHNEPQEKPTNEQEEDKRRQDAELLLLMQNAQVTENEPSNEPKPIEKTNEAQATEKEQIETKEEKPETTENIKPIETPCTPLATTVATKNTSNTSSDIRKSLRVKRLRTFTEEIVFDSPASSITYNLASISSPVVASSSNLAVSNPKRRKVENTDQSLPPEQVSEANENSKQNIKHEKKKEKTEDLIKETLKLAKNKHSKLKLDQMKLEEKNKNEKKKENKKPKEKEKQNQAKLEEEETPNKKRKKKKKDKKELLKKLIETSQQQLRQQQMLIEKELEKKTQKKLRKLLRKQEFALQQQIQQNTLSIFLNNQLIREQFQSNNIMLNSPTTNLMKNSQSTFNKVPKTPTPTLNPSFYNLLNSNTETVEQIQLQTGKLESQRSSSEPIKCTFANCDKTFRKQSLLDYHIKYYHYANQTSESNPTTTALSNQTVLDENDKNLNETETKLPTALSNQTITQPRKRRIQSNSNTTKQATCREDPYEVIHCKCAQNINRGFMIQCDVCLCWQHGDCEMIAKASDVPKRYYCWICKNPGNKLKKLKYENWIVNSLSENSITSDEEPFVVNREQLDSLNDCSRRYYNLNLLMFTLEHQMSMLNRITKENDFVLVDSNDEFEKLVQNITHLQESLIKLFNEFNQQVDEYEEKYNDKTSISKNMNLKELYNQIEAVMG